MKFERNLGYKMTPKEAIIRLAILPALHNPKEINPAYLMALFFIGSSKSQHTFYDIFRAYEDANLNKSPTLS